MIELSLVTGHWSFVISHLSLVVGNVLLITTHCLMVTRALRSRSVWRHFLANDQLPMTKDEFYHNANLRLRLSRRSMPSPMASSKAVSKSFCER